MLSLAFWSFCAAFLIAVMAEAFKAWNDKRHTVQALQQHFDPGDMALPSSSKFGRHQVTELHAFDEIILFRARLVENGVALYRGLVTRRTRPSLFISAGHVRNAQFQKEGGSFRNPSIILNIPQGDRDPLLIRIVCHAFVFEHLVSLCNDGC